MKNNWFSRWRITHAHNRRPAKEQWLKIRKKSILYGLFQDKKNELPILQQLQMLHRDYIR